MEASGVRMTAPLDFENVILDVRAGDALTLLVEGSAGVVQVRAESLPSVRAERVSALRDLDLITVDEAVRSEQEVLSEEGALIVSISSELQSQIGFRAGDVIVRINNVPIRQAEDAARVFSEIRGRRGVLRIVFERNGALSVRELLWRG